MTKIVASLYKYFSLKELPSPYFRTLILLSFFVILLFFLLYGVTPIPHDYNPFGFGKSYNRNFISGGLFLGLIYLILSVIFRKKDLDQYSFSDTELKYNLRKIIIVFVILFCLIMILAFFNIRGRLYHI